MKRLMIMAGTTLLLLAPFASSADDYQFIISGYPAANESHSAVSSGKALVSDALTAVSASQSLEARFRTWCESIGKALRSDDWANGLMIIVR